jgi:hypothetical protein
MSNDLVHVMPWHCMFALSTCKLLSLWPPSCPPSLYAPSKRPLLTRPSFTTLFRRPLRALPTDRKTMVRLDKKLYPFSKEVSKAISIFSKVKLYLKADKLNSGKGRRLIYDFNRVSRIFLIFLDDVSFNFKVYLHERFSRTIAP